MYVDMTSKNVLPNAKNMHWEFFATFYSSTLQLVTIGLSVISISQSGLMQCVKNGNHLQNITKRFTCEVFLQFCKLL